MSSDEENNNSPASSTQPCGSAANTAAANCEAPKNHRLCKKGIMTRSKTRLMLQQQILCQQQQQQNMENRATVAAAAATTTKEMRQTMVENSARRGAQRRNARKKSKGIKKTEPTAMRSCIMTRSKTRLMLEQINRNQSAAQHIQNDENTNNNNDIHNIHNDNIHNDNIHNDNNHNDNIHNDNIHNDNIHNDNIHNDNNHNNNNNHNDNIHNDNDNIHNDNDNIHNDNNNNHNDNNELKNALQLPDDFVDFDNLNEHKPFFVSSYAKEIFKYLKTRELKYQISNYMPRQTALDKSERCSLIDWIIQVNDAFKCQNDMRYQSVKIVDIYLNRESFEPERKIELLGAAAFCIADKYNNSYNIPIEQVIYIGNKMYTKEELLQMVKHVLKVINFDLGMPLPIEFLRRYLYATNVDELLGRLSYYILEMSLMSYEAVGLSESRKAAAALYLAFCMNATNVKRTVTLETPGTPAATTPATTLVTLATPSSLWTSTLIYYSEYQLKDFIEIVPVLQSSLLVKYPDTITLKYSEAEYKEVAKIPLLTREQLLHYTKLD